MAFPDKCHDAFLPSSDVLNHLAKNIAEIEHPCIESLAQKVE